jgi:hypothetical protein
MMHNVGQWDWGGGVGGLVLVIGEEEGAQTAIA